MADTWIVTNARGEILEASPAAAAMLSVTPMHLRRRSLLLFFLAERPEWSKLLGQAAKGESVERPAWIRPRDRRPRPVHVAMTEAEDYPERNAVIWRFSDRDAAPNADGA